MKKILINSLAIFLSLFATFVITAQERSGDRPLTDRIGWLDFVTVKISHNSERYERQEINVIYHQDSIMKIHSILKSNYKVDNQIDTTFTLNAQQLYKLDKFEIAFKNDSIPTGIVFAGTRTILTINISGQTMTLENRSDYSLIRELLNDE